MDFFLLRQIKKAMNEKIERSQLKLKQESRVDEIMKFLVMDNKIV